MLLGCLCPEKNECGTHKGRPEYMCQMNAALAKYYDEFVQKYYPDRISNVVIPRDELMESCEI